jgi:GTPase SAR1 family protein
MLFQTFEIKVALLGYVSVGKTTVLNALLQDEFSEVSMRRTTAGINFFRISTRRSNSKRKKPDIYESEGGRKNPKVDHRKVSENTEDEEEWSMIVDDPKTAESTLAEITADNSELRKTNKIQEKILNIELDGPLCEMRKDTKLTIVDVPGLNEAGTKAVYKQYVVDKWETFDCVVVVMDAEKGVNTEEQVELLHFVRDNLEKKKRVPVIVLCNKVDDPDAKELMDLVQEVREQVEKIFEVGSRSQALQQVLEPSKVGNGQPCNSTYPIFIPLSAGNAFAYRTASRLSLEEFKKLDIALIDKLGRGEVGNFKWKKLSLNAKYVAAYDAVSDTKQYQERLEATNFDKFLSAFSFCVGGDEVQRDLIEQQLTVSLRNLSFDSPVASQLRAIYERCKVLDKPTEQLKTGFWAIYEKLSKDAFSVFDTHMDTGGVRKALDELMGYSALATEGGWTDQSDMISMKMDELLRRQLSITLGKVDEWVPSGCCLLEHVSNDTIYVWNQRPPSWIAYVYRDHDAGFVPSGRKNRAPSRSPPEAHPWHWKQTEPNTWKNRYTTATWKGGHPMLGKSSWTNLSPHDWAQVLGSLLLVSSNKHFYLRFGREKMLLERHLQAFNSYFVDAPVLCDGSSSGHSNPRSTGNNPHMIISKMRLYHFMKTFMKGKYVNEVFTPDFPDIYETCSRVEVPELLSDPKHWGNTFWMYCEFKESEK